jgi:hypothetical protein
MPGTSLYSYPYFKLAKTLSFLLLLIFSSTKLEKRAEWVLPGSKGVGAEREGVGGVCAGGEMAQTMYAHMNK